jgi:hypothetical protein
MVGSLPFLLHERNLVKKLKDAGAISKETAKTVEELGLNELEIREIKRISRYTLSKTIKETEDSRYYVPCEE